MTLLQLYHYCIANVDTYGLCGFGESGHGVMAQLVARLNGIQKVRGSNPLSSTIKKQGFIPAFFVVELCGNEKF